MSLEFKKLKSGGQPGSAKVQVSFEGVIKKLKNEGSSAGFRAMRDYLLGHYKGLRDEFGPLGLMNLIMACDKHAIFVDMSAEKNKEHDQIRWKLFQDFMNGKINSFEDTIVEEDHDELSISTTPGASEYGSSRESTGE